MTEKNSKDEIDVLSLFSLIGKKTNSLLVLIINIFISILNLILLMLRIAKKNYLILLICAMLGALTGYFYDKNLYVPKYQTTLTLSPNFGSTYHLYKNIKFYQTLIAQKDFEKLTVYLNIDSTEFKSIKSISIEPFKTQSSQLSNYQKMLNNADSITALTLSYNEFKNKIPFDFYKLHVITLETTKSEIPSQLEESIISSLEKNTYYLNVKNTYLKNLEIKKEFVKSSIQKIDTLLFSKNFNTEESIKRENLGTTILLDDNEHQNFELKLFNKYTFLRDELIKINYDLENKKNIINTIDSFKVVGQIKNKKNFSFYGGAILFIITFFAVIIFQILKDLNPKQLFKFKKLDHETE